MKEIAESEGVHMTPDGCNAVIHLARGDMRKCLNLLQATFISFGFVNEENVYLCSGNPTPSEITRILEVLLNSSFESAFNYISEVQTERGFALSDIVREIHTFVLYLKDLPEAAFRHLLGALAELEYDLSFETSEKLQLGALVGIFQIGREITFSAMEG